MRSFLLLSILPLFFFFNGDGNTLKGRIINPSNNKPVPNVLVYVIEGEEEALTNNAGEFTIKTRKEFPLKVTVQDPTGSRKTVKYTAVSSNVTIEMP